MMIGQGALLTIVQSCRGAGDIVMASQRGPGPIGIWDHDKLFFINQPCSHRVHRSANARQQQFGQSRILSSNWEARANLNSKWSGASGTRTVKKVFTSNA